MRRLGIRRLVMLVSEAAVEDLITSGVSEEAIGNPAQLGRGIIDALNRQPVSEKLTVAPPVKAQRKAGYVLFIP